MKGSSDILYSLFHVHDPVSISSPGINCPLTSTWWNNGMSFFPVIRRGCSDSGGFDRLLLVHVWLRISSLYRKVVFPLDLSLVYAVYPSNCFSFAALFIQHVLIFVYGAPERLEDV